MYTSIRLYLQIVSLGYCNPERRGTLWVLLVDTFSLVYPSCNVGQSCVQKSSSVGEIHVSVTFCFMSIWCWQHIILKLYVCVRVNISAEKTLWQRQRLTETTAGSIYSFISMNVLQQTYILLDMRPHNVLFVASAKHFIDRLVASQLVFSASPLVVGPTLRSCFSPYLLR